MLTSEKAIQRFKAVYPKLNPISLIDYNNSHFVVTTHMGMYGVDKRTGTVGYFSPMSDLKKYSDAVRNRTIKKWEE